MDLIKRRKRHTSSEEYYSFFFFFFLKISLQLIKKKIFLVVLLCSAPGSLPKLSRGMLAQLRSFEARMNPQRCSFGS